MKPTFTLLACSVFFLLFGDLVAQNAMFVNHRQYATFAQVRDRVLQNPHLKLMYEEEDELLLIGVNGFRFRYQFERGNIYRVVMTNSYSDGERAREAEMGVLKFFKLIQALPLENINLANTHRYVARTYDRYFELMITYHTEDDLTFELISTYINRAPDHALWEYERMQPMRSWAKR